MDARLKKLYDLTVKIIKYERAFDNLAFSAIITGEQFMADHNRPMTLKESRDWIELKRKQLGI